MKTKLAVNKETETPKIDWTKQNLLVFDGTYVLTTGREVADGNMFEAVVVHDSSGAFEVGFISREFSKFYWELVTDEVTITFNAK